MSTEKAGTGWRHVDDGSTEAVAAELERLDMAWVAMRRQVVNATTLARCAETAGCAGYVSPAHGKCSSCNIAPEVCPALPAYDAIRRVLVRVSVPYSLREWAARVVAQRRDETDATTILTGVTLGELRAWLKDLG